MTMFSAVLRKDRTMKKLLLVIGILFILLVVLVLLLPFVVDLNSH